MYINMNKIGIFLPADSHDIYIFTVAKQGFPGHFETRSFFKSF